MLTYKTNKIYYYLSEPIHTAFKAQPVLTVGISHRTRRK